MYRLSYLMSWDEASDARGVTEVKGMITIIIIFQFSWAFIAKRFIFDQILLEIQYHMHFRRRVLESPCP